MYHRYLCRVHWLLLELSSNFKGYYKLLFDYNSHSYTFYRNYCEGRSNRLREVFIVVRTSKRCYRLMYYDDITKIFVYKSFRSARQCAYFMMEMHLRRYE